VDVEEPDELKCKRFEAMYAFTKDRLGVQEHRYEELEAKCSRMLTVLAVLLGLSGIGAGEVANVLKKPYDSLGIAVAGLLVLLFLSACTAVVAHLKALKFSKIEVEPATDGLLDHFQRNIYVDVLVSMSKANVRATRALRDACEEKAKYAKCGYVLTLFVVILGVLAVLGYVMHGVLRS